MIKNDYIGKCPLSRIEESCYITYINEKLKSYKSLVTGFESNDLMIDGEFDFKTYEETLPELYIDIKQKDRDGRIWYPQSVNVVDKGIVFVLGTNSEDWGFCGIKAVEVPENEKERFKDPQTGNYIKYKNDQSTLKQFTKFEFIEALSYVGILE